MIKRNHLLIIWPANVVYLIEDAIMKRKFIISSLIILLCMLPVFDISNIYAEGKVTKLNLDDKVMAFIESRRDTWRDMNIPETDGKILYDLIQRELPAREGGGESQVQHLPVEW